MKLYFALLALLVASASAGGHGKEEMKAKMQECLEENGVSKEDFKKAHHEENPSHNIKCVSFCIAKKMGMADEDGNTNMEKILSKFGKDETKSAAIKKCYDETKGVSDKCDKCHAFKKCFFKAAGFGKGKGKPRDDDD